MSKGVTAYQNNIEEGRRRERKQEEGRAGERTVTGCISHISNTRFSLKSLSYSFAGQEYQADTPSVMLLSLLVGLAGGIYGIGGGAIIAPFLVTFYGLPVYTVAGAALTGTMITSLAGVGFFRLLAFFMPETAIAPDWQLGLLFGLGGFAGMYCGARLQRFVPSRFIKSILAACILFTCTHYLF